MWLFKLNSRNGPLFNFKSNVGIVSYLLVFKMSKILRLNSSAIMTLKFKWTIFLQNNEKAHSLCSLMKAAGDFSALMRRNEQKG